MDLRVAATKYFEGEHREMIVILLTAGLAIAAAAVHWLRARDAFATGFAATLVLAGLLLGGTAAALLVRDDRTAPGIINELSTQGANSGAAAREVERIEQIIRNYPIYRYGAIALAVLATGLLAFSSMSWMHGVAVGLLFVVAAQTMIDHYSEARARAYAFRLGVQRTSWEAASGAST